jgi:hypothetical protein
MGEERLKKELAETKDELQRPRWWLIRGISTNKDLFVVSLVPKLVGIENIIPLE